MPTSTVQTNSSGPRSGLPPSHCRRDLLMLPISLPDAAIDTGSFPRGVPPPLRGSAFQKTSPQFGKRAAGAWLLWGGPETPPRSPPPAPPGPQAPTALAAGPAGALGEPEVTGSVTEGSVFGKGFVLEARVCFWLSPSLCSCMNPGGSVNRPAAGRGLYIFGETSLRTNRLRQRGKLRGREGLLSFPHKPEIIQQDTSD